MNVSNEMPGALVEAISIRPQREWEAYFDQLVIYKAVQIQSATDTIQLLQLQAKIACLQEIRALFLSEMQRSPRQPGQPAIGGR